LKCIRIGFYEPPGIFKTFVHGTFLNIHSKDNVQNNRIGKNLTINEVTDILARYYVPDGLGKMSNGSRKRKQEIKIPFGTAVVNRIKTCHRTRILFICSFIHSFIRGLCSDSKRQLSTSLLKYFCRYTNEVIQTAETQWLISDI
jgi:hypothetical protein